MKKIYSLLLSILLLIIVARIASGKEAYTRIKEVEGTLTNLCVYTDTITLTIKLPSGEELICSRRGTIDGMSREDREDLRLFKKENADIPLPSVTDVRSVIHLFYLPGRNNYFVGYKVISFPDALWAVIITSSDDITKASAVLSQASGMGFSTSFTLSDRCPSLKPGYWVVLAGIFDSADEAASCKEQARKKGWKDAYIKKIR